MNDLLLLKNHEWARVLEVVVKLRPLVLTLAPGVNGTRLHRQSTDELTAADSHDLIVIKNVLLLIWRQLVWRRLSFFDVSEAKATEGPLTPGVDMPSLGNRYAVKPSSFYFDDGFIRDAVVRTEIYLRGVVDHLVLLLL